MKNKSPFLKRGQGRRVASKSSVGTEVIYGKNAVFESLHQGTRSFHEILVLPQHYDDLLEVSKGVPIRVVQKHDMDKITATNHHQGIAAKVSAYQYAAPERPLPLKMCSTPGQCGRSPEPRFYHSHCTMRLQRQGSSSRNIDLHRSPRLL